MRHLRGHMKCFSKSLLLLSAGHCGDDLGGRSHHGCSSRNVVQHHRHRSNLAAISKMYPPQHLGISTQFDIITNDWRRTVGMAIAYGYPLPESATGTDHCLFVHEDIAEVPDSQARANSGTARQTDAKYRLSQTKNGPIDRTMYLSPPTIRPSLDTAPPTIDPDGPDRLLFQKRPAQIVALQISHPVRVPRHQCSFQNR